MRHVAYPLAAHGYLERIASSPPSPTSVAPAAPPCAEILGIPLAISDYEEVLDWMQALIAADRRGYVTAAAVNLPRGLRAGQPSAQDVNEFAHDGSGFRITEARILRAQCVTLNA